MVADEALAAGAALANGADALEASFSIGAGASQVPTEGSLLKVSDGPEDGSGSSTNVGVNQVPTEGNWWNGL